MEKLVNSRLMWILEKNRSISNYQSGFRKNRSTTDSLVQFQCNVEKAIIRGEHTIAVFFDLTKAYDMTWKYGIMQKLYKENLTGHLLIFIQNFLTDRKIRVRVGNAYSPEYVMAEGVPQGSVVSCTCFALGVDDCLNGLPAGVEGSLYVDDLLILCSGRNINSVERSIQRAINKLEKWSNETGFKFSPTKTVAMHICRTRNCPKAHRPLTMYGQPISWGEKHKYLGLTVDNGLRWTEHVKQLKKECNQRMNLLKHLSSTTWGADMRTLKMLYQTLIKPKLEYGNEIYESTCDTNSKSLIPIRNNALRIATGAFRTSPIESIEVLTGTLPYYYNVECKLLNYVMRIYINDKNPMKEILHNEIIQQNPSQQEQNQTNFTRKTFAMRSMKALSECNLNLLHIKEENTPLNPPWDVKEVNICKDMSQLVKREVPPIILKNMFLGHLREHEIDSYQIFTDGSKTENGVAFAVYSEHFSIPQRINNCASIFTAELTAILEALKHSRSINNSSISIITDSKSSIQAIRKLYPQNPIIIQIQDLIKNSDKNFTLCWVPSHIGVQGNERADSLAVAATSNETIYQHENIRSDIKAYIRKNFKKRWKEKWQLSLHNKLFEITNDLKTLAHTTCTDRFWERSLMRLRIGHSRLTHGYLMNQSGQPSCEYCGEDIPLTIKHILVECPRHTGKRTTYFRNETITLRQILNEGDTSQSGSLYKFLQEIEILPLL